MTSPPRSRPRLPGLFRRRSRHPAALVVPAALAAALLAAPAAAAPAARFAGPGLAMPGPHGSLRTVTLITGDQLTLAATGLGQYAINSASMPGAGPSGIHSALTISASSGPHGTSMYAEPASASRLVSEGKVDAGLFSPAQLAARETPSGGGSLPVAVQYATAAGLAHAPSLPGATRTATAGAPNAAIYQVNLQHAAAFWAAVSGAAGPAPVGRPRNLLQQQLADGITRIWLAGDLPPAPAATPRPQDGLSAYTVTETITGRGQPFYTLSCGRVTVCLQPASPQLFGVAGPGEGVSYQPANITCAVIDSSGTCTALQAVYQVPAGVYSSADAWAYFMLNDQEQDVDLSIPQFTVAGDTSFTASLSQAHPVTVTTPRPVEATYGSMYDFRSAPDGQNELSGIMQASTGTDTFVNDWAIPSPRVTVGTFHFATDYTMDAPQVTMAVTTPKRLTLHPWYPFAYSHPWSSTGAWRFSGKSALPLADVGFGSAQDFGGKDVRGKLVLMRPNHPADDNPEHGCPTDAGVTQLQNALQAGAAGVIFDPTGTRTDPNAQGTNCRLPIVPVAGPGNFIDPDIPAVSIPSAEATTLRALLARGSVTIDVSDSGPSPYAYNLKFYQEGGIPASMQHTVTNAQLATVHTRYHLATSQPVQVTQITTAFELDEASGMGLNEEFFPGPAARTEYYGPVSPYLAWLGYRQADTFGFAPTTWNVFSQPGNTSEDIFQQPYAPGTAYSVSPDVLQAQPEAPRFPDSTCGGCRAGNTFYPEMSKVSGAESPDDWNAAGGLAGLDPSKIHLYQGGNEIQPTPVDGFAAYSLPPQQQRYQLAVDSSTGGGDDDSLDPDFVYNTHTIWDFTSAAPASDQTPPGYQCFAADLGQPATPCAPAPLIFLRYNAFTGLTNSVTAPGAHQLRVTAYYQAPDHPAVTSLKLWTSTDGGKTWQRARVTGGRGGIWTATYTLPQLPQADRYVSIKAQAADAAGNDITQTITDAYGIAAATSAAVPAR